MSKGLEMCDKCDYFISVEEAYQQGRADAIDDYTDWLRKHTLTLMKIMQKILKVIIWNS